MKRSSWNINLALILIVISAVTYIIQIELFHDQRSTYFYMLQDLAFVPVNVLLVTLILNELMVRREKLAMQKKMNMAISVFFGEVGTDLLKRLYDIDLNASEMKAALMIGTDWNDAKFKSARKIIESHSFQMDRGCSLAELKTFLLGKRAFMLTLLENPNLLEHESFTDLLWAVFHLTDELSHRNDPCELIQSDRNHIAGDINRVYVLLMDRWISYMKHLKDDYPYIFSLLVRTNPFDETADAVVKS